MTERRTTERRTSEPSDAAARRAVRAVPVYRAHELPPFDFSLRERAVANGTVVGSVTVPPREARSMRVPAGHGLAISLPEGSQVGDLNLWNADDWSEQLFTGKTRALHGTHITRGDRLWSTLPHLRPMATLVRDTLQWYGHAPDGTGVHDVIGTRCDPYTNRLIAGTDYHHCCHSNLLRAFAEATGVTVGEAEAHVHDVLNVFMCTGFEPGTGRYIMKSSPARRGDALVLFAEIDLLAALSACPGGDCSSGHSSDDATCHPIRMDVIAPAPGALGGWEPPRSPPYSRSHGL